MQQEYAALVLSVHARTVARALAVTPPRSAAHRRGRRHAAGAAAVAERVAKGTPLPAAFALAHDEAHLRAADAQDLGSLPANELQAYVRRLNTAVLALRAGAFIAGNPYVSHKAISQALQVLRLTDALQEPLRNP